MSTPSSHALLFIPPFIACLVVISSHWDRMGTAPLAFSSDPLSSPFIAVFAPLILAFLTSLYLPGKRPLAKGTPPLAPDAYPVIGSLHFYTERADFIARSTASLARKTFSFYVGNWLIIGVTGKEYRKAFFESRGLSLARGYLTLIAGLPQVKEDTNPFSQFHIDRDEGFPGYFHRRLLALLKKPRLERTLPYMLRDARKHFDRIAKDPRRITEPFGSIYRAVFSFTIRTVGCHEVADSPELMETILDLYESVEESVSPIAVILPWLPTLSKLKKMYVGARLYRIFGRIQRARIAENRREDDSLQFLMDQGDSTIYIVSFILTSLFAGQLNTGVMASWIVVELAKQPQWLNKISREVIDVADRHTPKDLPLRDRVMQIPFSAWENEFPMIDLCLKESIRLRAVGTVIRRNVSDKAIALDLEGEELVPPGAFVVMSVNDIMHNEENYDNASAFEPSRYLPGREEDKRSEYNFFGWGAGLHPCPGATFAKLETNILIAFMVAYFPEVQIVDEAGKPTDKTPEYNHNATHVTRPKEPCYMSFKLQD